MSPKLTADLRFRTAPGQSVAVTSPYDHLDARHFWRLAIAEVEPLQWRGLYEKRFALEPGAQIATAGSCFAQHIGRQLKRRGFGFLDLEPAPPSLSAQRHTEFGYGLFSARYGNIYTARQLLQLVKEAFKESRPRERIWPSGGRFFDPFRPSVEPNGFASPEELLALRQLVLLPAVREVLARCDVFVFTLGLTEAWISRLDGAVFPACPGTVAGEFDAARHAFHNFGFEETYADMVAFIERLRSINPGAKVLLTVSPVPLTATAGGQHVLVSTTYSKSVLRAVAGALYQRFDFVDYFPSYEIVTAPAMGGALYAPDKRNVTAAGVEHVMSHFFVEHAAEGGFEAREPDQAGSARAPYDADHAAELEEFRAVCDEEKLDPALR